MPRTRSKNKANDHRAANVSQASNQDGKLVMASLFTGLGTFPIAFEEAGVKVKFTCDKDPVARQVYVGKFPNATHYGNVSEVDVDMLRGIDLLEGGFPCITFSRRGKRTGLHAVESTTADGPSRREVGQEGRSTDDPAQALKKMLELLQEASTRGFPVPNVLFENVEGFLDIVDKHSSAKERKKSPAMDYLSTELEQMTYNWAYCTIRSAAFGLPSGRERLFIFACLPSQGDPRDLLLAWGMEHCVGECMHPFEGCDNPGPCIDCWVKEQDQRDAQRQKPSQDLADDWSGYTLSVDLGNAQSSPGIEQVATQTASNGAPFVLMPGKAGLMTVEGGERIQGHTPGQLKASGVADRDAWRLLGNAVSLPVAKFLAYAFVKWKSGHTPQYLEGEKDIPFPEQYQCAAQLIDQHGHRKMAAKRTADGLSRQLCEIVPANGDAVGNMRRKLGKAWPRVAYCIQGLGRYARVDSSACPVRLPYRPLSEEISQLGPIPEQGRLVTYCARLMERGQPKLQCVLGAFKRAQVLQKPEITDVGYRLTHMLDGLQPSRIVMCMLPAVGPDSNSHMNTASTGASSASTSRAGSSRGSSSSMSEAGVREWPAEAWDLWQLHGKPEQFAEAMKILDVEIKKLSDEQRALALPPTPSGKATQSDVAGTSDPAVPAQGTAQLPANRLAFVRFFGHPRGVDHGQVSAWVPASSIAEDFVALGDEFEDDCDEQPSQSTQPGERLCLASSDDEDMGGIQLGGQHEQPQPAQTEVEQASDEKADNEGSGEEVEANAKSNELKKCRPRYGTEKNFAKAMQQADDASCTQQRAVLSILALAAAHKAGVYNPGKTEKLPPYGCTEAEAIEWARERSQLICGGGTGCGKCSACIAHEGDPNDRRCAVVRKLAMCSWLHEGALLSAMGKKALGSRVRIWWSKHDMYFCAMLKKWDSVQQKFYVQYDDNDGNGWEDLWSPTMLVQLLKCPDHAAWHEQAIIQLKEYKYGLYAPAVPLSAPPRSPTPFTTASNGPQRIAGRKRSRKTA